MQYTGGAWQPVATDTFGRPPFGLPPRWYQLRSNAAPLPFDAGNVVRIPMAHSEIGEWWETGQVLRNVTDSPTRTLPGEGSVMLDSLVAGGMFIIDSTQATRQRLLPHIERIFPDTFAVSDPTGRTPGLRRGRAPINRLTVHRTVRTRRSNAALILVEAERCVGLPPFACSMTLLVDAWLQDEAGFYRVLSQRGPLLADEDFKSGGSGLRARAWLEVDGRRFLLVDEVNYFFINPFVAELLPSGVHPMSQHPVTE
jgi:hypothetical protein